MSHYHRSRRAAPTAPGPYHRLNQVELAEISARYAASGITQAQLAYEYGVSRGTVIRALARTAGPEAEPGCLRAEAPADASPGQPDPDAGHGPQIHPR
jgi:hypothetical protein